MHKPIYIVAGDGPRCGSTMMMNSLEAGGMECVYSIPDLKELTIGEQYAPDFLQGDSWFGKAVKMLLPPQGRLADVPILTQHLVKIVWLTRDVKDRWASFKRIAIGDSPVEDYASHFFLASQLSATTKAILSRCERIEVVEMAYKDVTAEPLKWFSKLVKDGWVIDPAKAAQIPHRKVQYA